VTQTPFSTRPFAYRPTVNPFTEGELRRLQWVRVTVIAERHRLEGPHQSCDDHQACRRLAFALWLRCRGSLNEFTDTE
jgi:hypothetical protein